MSLKLDSRSACRYNLAVSTTAQTFLQVSKCQLSEVILLQTYGSLAWDGIRHSQPKGRESEVMVGPHKLKDYIFRLPEELCCQPDC